VWAIWRRGFGHRSRPYFSAEVVGSSLAVCGLLGGWIFGHRAYLRWPGGFRSACLLGLTTIFVPFDLAGVVL